MSASRPQRHDMEPMYRGEDIRQPFQTDPPTDITLWTMGAQLKAVDAAGVPTGAVLATGTLNKTAPTTGGYEVIWASTDIDRTPAEYFHDVWRLDGGSKKVLVEGKAPILPYETRF